MEWIILTNVNKYRLAPDRDTYDFMLLELWKPSLQHRMKHVTKRNVYTDTMIPITLKMHSMRYEQDKYKIYIKFVTNDVTKPDDVVEITYHPFNPDLSWVSSADEEVISVYQQSIVGGKTLRV